MVLAGPSTLAAALALGSAGTVAFTGGGGKTTAMFRLARELDAARVLVTTTTRIWLPTTDQARTVLEASIEAASAQLAQDSWPGGIR